MLETPSRAEIEAGQLARLRHLVAEMLPRNGFYRAKLGGLNPAVASLADFSARFPFTTKQELIDDQAGAPPFGTNLTFPLESYTRFHQTSGTTRAPLRWLDTPESWRSMVESWKAIYRAAGVQAGDRIYFAFSFGPFLGFWLAFDAAQDLGCLCLPGGGLSTEGRWRAILDNGATVLCCTPSYALRLAEAASAAGRPVSDSAVRALIVAGEPGGSVPATRRRLQSYWPQARIVDHHGMTETGPVSCECPHQTGALHILENAYLAEIIDDNGRPAAPGAPGELVLTTLTRTASPLLRYRTGDRAQFAAACACGRPDRALAGGILGRVDEMVIVRGVNVYPTALEDVLRGFAEIVEYQAQLDRSGSLAELTLQIEPAADCTDSAALVQRLQLALHAAFNLRIPITVAAPGALPRYEMKARRWRA
ncbi:MAG TPA: AMP-binding protein [Verrucomicrobiae bacterium]|jgi:phenylacetate-CoA ligase|nr:AMP-binding protein [Verrucomicrobiae bacterium]